MLRINVHDDGEVRTLELQGRLVGEWVGELARVAHTALGDRRPLRLALDGLTFADGSGADLLRELRGGGAQLDGCSEFIGALVNGGSEWQS